MPKNNHFSLDLLCSSSKFLNALDDYIIEREYSHTDEFGWVRDLNVYPGTTNNLVFLWDKKAKHKTLTFLKVVDGGENRSRLRIHFFVKDFDKHKGFWDILYEDLKGLGLVKDDNQIFPLASTYRENQKVLTDYEIPSNIESSKVDEYEWLNDYDFCKEHHPDYNYVTMINILQAFKSAHSLWKSEGGAWGPKFFDRVKSINSVTVSRYLKALKNMGVAKVDNITIPHRTQKPKQ